MKSQGKLAVPLLESPELTAIRELFARCRESQKIGDIIEARKVERQVSRLVAQVASVVPNSDTHAEALQMHGYVLLAVAAASKRKDVLQKFRNAAYVQIAAAMSIELQSARAGIGSVFRIHNLAVDLIHSQNRAEEGLMWMLEAKMLLTKLARKKRLPANILMFKLFSVDYGIAKAHYDLGNRKASRRIVTRALAQAPKLNNANWADLRSIAKAAELLAQIKLDDLDAVRSKAV